MLLHLCKGMYLYSTYEILRSYAGIIRIRFSGIISAPFMWDTPANNYVAAKLQINFCNFQMGAQITVSAKTGTESGVSVPIVQ